MRLVTAEGIPLKIGAPSHRSRNLWLLAAFAAAVAAPAGYYALMGRHDAVETNRLESFRSQYAQRCDEPAFAAPAPVIVRDAYLRSSALRAAVSDATSRLEAGAACDEIARRLRAADFPMPAVTVTPTIHLQPTR
jgi:hypothetical protein